MRYLLRIKPFYSKKQHQPNINSAQKYQSIYRLLPVPYSLRSVYFTENSGYRSLKNRSCVTVFGSCCATLTVGEPLGDVSGSANHDFRTSVTGISCEIDASYSLMPL